MSIALLGALVCAENRAEDVPARSVRADDYLSRRVVHAFDFEEKDENNYEKLPRYWYTIGGPGFPGYTADETGFDDTQHVSGSHSFRLRSNGGSAAAMVEHGAIAAVPGADYIVTAKLKTDRLKNSRARMVAYFVDQHGRRIAESQSPTPLTESNGRWTRIEARLDGEFDKAAWIVLRLELLQADEFRPPTLGKHEVYQQDIGATAWFDDVVIFQLPRVEINSQSATNVIRGPDRPKLDITVRDQTGDRLTAVVQVYDHMGRPIDRQQRVFAGRQAPTWHWTPKIKRFGWYWADLTVNGERGVVGRRAVGLAWLPPMPTIAPAEADRFGIIAESMSEDERRMLRPMMDRLGANAVIIDIWRGDRTVTITSDDPMPDDPVVNGLLADGRSVTLSIARAPTPLAEAADTDAHLTMDVLRGDPKNWQPHLRPLAVTYAQPVRRWQIGPVGSDEAYWRKDLAQSYSAIAQWLKGIVPAAVVSVPWSVQRQLPAGADRIDALTVSIPTSVRPNLIAGQVEALGLKQQRLSLAIDWLDPRQFDHHERAADLAMRLVEATRLNPETVYIGYPWNRGEARRELTATPDPMLAVFANTVDRLSGRRFVGEMRLASGVKCYILDGPAGGALVAWNETSPQTDVPLDLFLGDQPVVVDIWGNRKPVERDEHKHRLTVGKMPIFIEGINAQLARFRSLLRFDPGFVESSYKVHQLELVIVNPWPRTITGTLRLDGVEHWKINPRLVNFSIAAGQTRRVAMNVTFPVSELAGEKQITGRIELDADDRYVLDVAVPLEIGLRDIDFNPTVSIDQETGDVMVTSLVTNRGDEPRSLYAFVLAGELARQQRIITNLQPNQTAIKRFRLPGLRDELLGESIRVGLREMDGPAMVNQLLQVH